MKAPFSFRYILENMWDTYALHFIEFLKLNTNPLPPFSREINASISKKDGAQSQGIYDTVETT